jgi:GntR family transcriptional regulator / MocR family aminotransferase
LAVTSENEAATTVNPDPRVNGKSGTQHGGNRTSSGPQIISSFMDKTWAISGVDLHLDLSGYRVRAGLEAALREAAQAGRLAPGTRLPSSRALSADLGIARNTVAEAYGQLTAEGWLTAQQGSGTRVARTEVPSPAAASIQPSPVARQDRYDLRAGRPDLSAFPRAGWLSAARKALSAAPYLRF